MDTDAIVETLRTWVEHESPSPDADAVNGMMDIVAKEAESVGLTVSRTSGRDGYGDILKLETQAESNSPRLLVLTHADTVHAVGTLETLPFKQDGDKLYGPGIYDMKGGAYLALHAIRKLKELGSGPAMPVTIMVMPDEEAGSPTSKDSIEAEAKRAAVTLVVEPAREGGKIVTARKGAARYYLTATGKPAHSGSRHQDGASAIREIAAKTVGLEAMTDYGKGVTVNVGVIEAGTAVNVIPSRATAEIDIRIPTPGLAAEIDERMNALEAEIPGVTLEVTGGLNRPPMERTAGVSALFDHAHGLASDIGIDLETVPQTGGGSDGNFTAAMGIPTLDGLGVDGAGAHTLDEHLLVSSIAPRCALLASLLETITPETVQALDAAKSEDAS
jgi:glutamate carboxypeptidase